MGSSLVRTHDEPKCDASVAHSLLVLHIKSKHHQEVSWLYSHCSCQYTYSRGIKKKKCRKHRYQTSSTPTRTSNMQLQTGCSFIPQSISPGERGHPTEELGRGGGTHMEQGFQMTSSLVSLAFFFPVWNRIRGHFCFCIRTSVALNAMRLIADLNHVLQAVTVSGPHTSVKTTHIHQCNHLAKQME